MKPLIVITGPTACGKTPTAVELAKLVDGEIISADSMQIYRGMDIGTAKPTLEERGGILHHMLDIIDVTEKFSAARFADMARGIIDDIHERGKMPILAGGTGFYINATVYDNLLLPDFPRESLRLLYDVMFVVLYRDRARLYEAINQRVLQMIDRGLVGEVRGLMEEVKEVKEVKGLMKEMKGLVEAGREITAMQALGYKEIVPYLNGECSLDEAVAVIQRGSRRYAKRQMTWFRHQIKGGCWLCMDDLLPKQAAGKIKGW